MKRKILKWTIVVITVLFVALTFGPCIHMTTSHSDMRGENTTVTVSYENGGPILCGIIACFELLLLFRSQKRWAKIIRLILSVLIMICPLLIIEFFSILCHIVESISYDNFAHTMYQATSFAYFVTGIGLVLVICNIIDLFLSEQEANALSPESFGDKALARVIANENAHTCLTSTAIPMSENLVRYSADQLPDMYDNNFFKVTRKITEEDYLLMLRYKEQRGEGHMKVVCYEPSSVLESKGLSMSILLTMMKNDRVYPNQCMYPLRFRNLKEENIKNDLINLEVKHYAEKYGNDFTLRKCNWFYDLAREKENSLNYFAAYIGDTLVASCSAYYRNDVVRFDELLTDRDFRHQGIATALMAYVHSYYDCPLFLHADADDTPKEMYQSMGFVTMKIQYEYLTSIY